MRRRRGSEQLLSYKDGPTWRELRSSHVNDYLRRTTGDDYTAKDFRTWHATVLAAAALAESEEPGEMKEVSEFLGNTPTLARSSYVDPRVVDLYEEGVTIANATRRHHRTADERQAALERAVLKLLK
jgi:DNA topoisomerase-1